MVLTSCPLGNIKEIQDVFPEQTPLDRSALNSWEDRRVVNWVKQTGKKKLAMAGLRTGVRLQMPVLSALADAYEVYFLTDASAWRQPRSSRHGGPAHEQGGGDPDNELVLRQRIAA